MNIVVGPCTKDYWYGVDQNWYTNNATGSPPYKIKHSYHDGPGGGVKYFVRPPYHPEKSTRHLNQKMIVMITKKIIKKFQFGKM